MRRVVYPLPYRVVSSTLDVRYTAEFTVEFSRWIPSRVFSPRPKKEIGKKQTPRPPRDTTSCPRSLGKSVLIGRIVSRITRELGEVTFILTFIRQKDFTAKRYITETIEREKKNREASSSAARKNEPQMSPTRRDEVRRLTGLRLTGLIGIYDRTWCARRGVSPSPV